MEEHNIFIPIILFVILIGMISLGIYILLNSQEAEPYTLYQFKDGTKDYCRSPEIWGSRYNYKDCCSGLIHTMATDVIEYGMAIMNCSVVENIRK